MDRSDLQIRRTGLAKSIDSPLASRKEYYHLGLGSTVTCTNPRKANQNRDYLYVKAGYAVGDIEGAYASIGVGIRFGFEF